MQEFLESPALLFFIKIKKFSLTLNGQEANFCLFLISADHLLGIFLINIFSLWDLSVLVVLDALTILIKNAINIARKIHMLQSITFALTVVKAIIGMVPPVWKSVELDKFWILLPMNVIVLLDIFGMILFVFIAREVEFMMKLKKYADAQMEQNGMVMDVLH